jgi:hypothetical protein
MIPPSGTRQIFINFAQRDLGLRADHAAWEYDNKLTGNGHALLRDFYLHTSRLGAPFAMTRAERRSLYLTFENAQSHAFFALEA